MHGSKRVFRPAKTAEEEKKLLEGAVPKSTRNATKWAYRIFNEWQLLAQRVVRLCSTLKKYSV